MENYDEFSYRGRICQTLAILRAELLCGSFIDSAYASKIFISDNQMIRHFNSDQLPRLLQSLC